MHPALSVILFTVSSGAGFGMLALLGLAAAVQPQEAPAAAVIAEFAIAFALTSANAQPSPDWKICASAENNYDEIVDACTRIIRARTDSQNPSGFRIRSIAI